MLQLCGKKIDEFHATTTLLCRILAGELECSRSKQALRGVMALIREWIGHACVYAVFAAIACLCLVPCMLG